MIPSAVFPANPGTWLTAGFVAVLGTAGLQAQQIVEVTGQDRHLDAAFEEVFRVGALERPWEMLGTVRRRLRWRGNLYIFDGSALRPAGGTLESWCSTPPASSCASSQHGKGPGEFDVPVPMAVLRDGNPCER